MKKLAALLGLCVLLLSGAAAGQQTAIAAAEGQPTRSLQSVYTVHARGMDVGEFSFNFNQNGAAYDVSARRRATGFARTLIGDQQDYTYSARGAVAANGDLQPNAYQHRGGKRHRTVTASFTPNDVTTTSEPRMGMGTPPANAAQKRGVMDQLTAIASLVSATSDPCSEGTIKVYMDGRSRFDFVMAPNGQVNVNNAAYHGPAIRCRVQFRPIAGFSDPQDPAELTFLFAPTSAGLFAPIQIQMPSDDAGLITMNATRLSVNGAALH